MTITKTAYAFVEAEGSEPKCAFHAVDDAILEYFSTHIDKLLRKATLGSIDPARFAPSDGSDPEARFSALVDGADEDFLAAAQQLADRLFAKSDKRMKRGFFVAVRREDDTDTAAQPIAAVMKLDASNVPAAAIGADASGEDVFQAVKDLLDVPGNLRKGAVYPDPRGEKQSDLAVVDDFDTLYFLRTLEAQRFLRGRKAVTQFVDVLDEVAPEAKDEVIKALGSRKRATSATTALKAVPGLSADQRKLAAKKLNGAIAVAQVNPAKHPTRATIVADDITIHGPTKAVDDNVTWTRRTGGWTIKIDTARKPTRTDR